MCAIRSCTGGIFPGSYCSGAQWCLFWCVRSHLLRRPHSHLFSEASLLPNSGQWDFSIFPLRDHWAASGVVSLPDQGTWFSLSGSARFFGFLPQDSVPGLEAGWNEWRIPFSFIGGVSTLICHSSIGPPSDLHFKILNPRMGSSKVCYLLTHSSPLGSREKSVQLSE